MPITDIAFKFKNRRTKEWQYQDSLLIFLRAYTRTSRNREQYAVVMVATGHIDTTVETFYARTNLCPCSIMYLPTLLKWAIGQQTPQK